MNTIWSFEQGKIWATCSNGQRIATWTASPSLSRLVDLLNVNPGLSGLLLAPWTEMDNMTERETALTFSQSAHVKTQQE